jgi:hypothetical protein
MEIKMTPEDFDRLCQTSTQNNDYEGCFYHRQFGRFENSLHNYDAPPVKRWKMLYWIDGGSESHLQWMFMRQYLEDRCFGYDLMWDGVYPTREGSSVIFTDYISPTWAKHYEKRPGVFPDETP